MSNSNTSIRPYIRFLSGLCFLLIAAACDTEYENAPYPYKEITSFSVASAGTSIEAAIVDGQIVLYWPHTLEQPATINPLITVSENASINPASGATVALEDGTTYTVTAQDGTSTTYTVKLIVNQPAISINEDNDNRIAFGNILDIQGAGFLPDSVANRVYLVATDGTETQVPLYAVSDNNGTGFGSNIQVTIPEENTTAIDTGWYRVKVRSGARTVESSRAYIYVRYPYPEFDPVTSAITVKRGETITLSGNNFRQLENARIWVEDGSESYYDIERVSYTRTTVTYRIPETVPAGEYFTILPGITDTATGEFAYSYALYAYPNIHPLLIVTDQPTE